MLKRVAIPSPNFSSRGGATVRLIVLHTAEGAQSYQSLGAFFERTSSQVSSHVGIDDSLGMIGHYVQPGFKAWTAANANPVAVQAELCAFARWPTSEWDKHPNMLSNCANWIAEEAKRFGVPIVRLNPQQAQSNGHGVCQHKDLGAWGGGHVDCGAGFPMDRVLEMARDVGKAKPDPLAIFPTSVGDKSLPNEGNERKTVSQVDGALKQPQKYRDYLKGKLRADVKTYRDRAMALAKRKDPPAWNDDRRLGARWHGLNERMKKIDAIP